MLVQTPNETFKFIDFHKPAPSAACQDDTNASLYGGLVSTKAVLSKNPTWALDFAPNELGLVWEIV